MLSCNSSVDHVAHVTVRLRAGSPPQLSQLIQRRRLRLFGHVARMDVSFDISRALKTSIRGLFINWKRPSGRPRHTWLRTLGADFQPYNLGLNSAWKYAPKSRTLEAHRGSRYAPVRGTRLMIMMKEQVKTLVDTI